jgi:hypothetical protein
MNCIGVHGSLRRWNLRSIEVRKAKKTIPFPAVPVKDSGWKRKVEA